MRVLIGIWHPGHVHLFRNFINEMEKRDHTIKIVARSKEHSLHLLDHYGLDYHIVGAHVKASIKGKARNALQMVQEISNWMKDNPKPDVVTGVGDMYIGAYGRLNGIPSVIFTDDDIWTLNSILYLPLANTILTPKNFNLSFSKLIDHKQIGYYGYHELAYLYPSRYTPDHSIYKELGIETGSKYVIMRFVSWGAAHDINKQGIPSEEITKSIKRLEECGVRVFISSEKKLPDSLSRYQIQIRPDRIHHALHFASLFICDSQTMATEAAILGTPVIRSNSFVGKNDISNFTELEKKFGLIFNIRNFESCIEKGIKILSSDNTEREWEEKQSNLVNNKIDVTRFLVWFFENYPKSIKIIQQKPSMQKQFQ